MKVTITHPQWGTVYLRECYIENGYVIGITGRTRDTMNFPVSCIKDIELPTWRVAQRIEQLPSKE